MPKNTKWTYKDIQYLKNHWGDKSQRAIAKTLDRTTTAIKIKAHRIGLIRSTEYGEYITFNQFCNLINKPAYRKYTKKLFNAKFPIKNILIVRKKIAVIYMNEFWKWLKKNIHLVDFQYTDETTFGIEPEWVKYKRDADKRMAAYEPRKWTETEDKKLLNYVQSYKYTYRELSIIFKRTESAIKRRLHDLKTPIRPIPADNHNFWKKSEIDTVKDLYLKGYKSQIIAEYVDRSALAINGLLERHNYFRKDVIND